MNLARLSKKVPHEDHRETLPSLHKKRLDGFAKERATLPDQEKLLEQLIKQYYSDNCSVNRYDLFDKINKLQIHVKNLRENNYENKYLLHAAPFLLRYSEESIKSRKKQEQLINKKKEELHEMYKESIVKETETDNETTDYETETETDNNEDDFSDISKFVKHEESTSKGQIYKEFSYCCSGDNYMTYPRKLKNDLELLVCDCGGKRIVIPSEAIATCKKCGDCINYVDDTGPVEYRSEVEILSPFALILALKSMMHCVFGHYTMKTIKISEMNIICIH